MKYSIGDTVRIIRGYRGYYAATVIEHDGRQYLVELSSGMQISCFEDELEDA